MSFAFDPVAAAETYADMETEELVRIAYLEPDYLPEAKALAMQELDKRGVPANRESLIRQVRDERIERADALERRREEKSQHADLLQYRIVAGTLIGGLWFVALLAPSLLKEWTTSRNVAGLILLGGWAIAIVGAVRKWRRGSRRQFYLVVLTPGVLFVLGVAIRWVI